MLLLVTSGRAGGSPGYEPPTRENVTDGQGRVAGGPVRGAARPSANGRLPDARLTGRGRGRGAELLAAAQRRRHLRGREPGRVADHSRGAGVPEDAAVPPGAPGGAVGRDPAAGRRSGNGQPGGRG